MDVVATTAQTTQICGCHVFRPVSLPLLSASIDFFWDSVGGGLLSRVEGLRKNGYHDNHRDQDYYFGRHGIARACRIDSLSRRSTHHEDDSDGEAKGRGIKQTIPQTLAGMPISVLFLPALNRPRMIATMP